MHRRVGISLIATMAAITILFVSAGTALSAAPRKQSPSTTNLIVGLNIADIRTVNAEVAIKQGFFKRQHLNVTLVNLESSDAIAALENGSIQIGEADPIALLQAYNLGHNLKMLSGGAHAEFLLVALGSVKCAAWNSPFPGPLSCLVGHSIGTPEFGDSSHKLGIRLIGEVPSCTTGGAHCVTWVRDANPLLWIPQLQSGAIQAQVSWAATLPIYAANHLKVWTVANAQLPDSARGNAGKLAPLNLTSIPVASAAELSTQPKSYQGFCQAIANANAWLKDPKHLNHAGTIAMKWLGEGTTLKTAIAEVKLQNAANVTHVSAAQWRGSEQVDHSVSEQPYKNVNWSGCDKIKANA